jgi:hypothetical protein
VLVILLALVVVLTCCSGRSRHEKPQTRGALLLRRRRWQLTWPCWRSVRTHHRHWRKLSSWLWGLHTPQTTAQRRLQAMLVAAHEGGGDEDGSSEEDAGSVAGSDHCLLSEVERDGLLGGGHLASSWASR